MCQRSIKRFEVRSGAKLGGLIINLRRVKNELQMVQDFAQKIGTRIIGIIPFSQIVKECGGQAKTVFTLAP